MLIAMGTGPSYYDCDVLPHDIVVSCGIAPLRHRCNYYCICDPIHNQVQKLVAHKATVVASRCMNDWWQPAWVNFEEQYDSFLPPRITNLHSGLMAIIVAADLRISDDDVINIVGFDDSIDKRFSDELRYSLGYLAGKGIKMKSLMTDSVFNPFM